MQRKQYEKIGDGFKAYGKANSQHEADGFLISTWRYLMNLMYAFPQVILQ